VGAKRVTTDPVSYLACGLVPKGKSDLSDASFPSVLRRWQG